MPGCSGYCRLAAVALAVLGRSRASYADGWRVCGRAGRTLSYLLGSRAGARGCVWVAGWLGRAALSLLKRDGRLYRVARRLSRLYPDLLYPLSPSRAARAALDLGLRAAAALTRGYRLRYSGSRVARIYRRVAWLRRARAAAWNTDISSCLPPGVTVEDVAETVAYRCGLLYNDALRLVESRVCDAATACGGDPECIISWFCAAGA